MNRPLFVLELTASATPAEIERQGRKLLGLLELGGEKAAWYTCPFGRFRRDASMVREAMAALRDPRVRAREGFLIELLTGVDESPRVRPMDPLPDAFRVGGYEGL